MRQDVARARARTPGAAGRTSARRRARASCASSACAEPRDEIVRQERRVAGHGDGVARVAPRQPRVQPGERTREAADGVGHDRMAERGVRSAFWLALIRIVADLRREALEHVRDHRRAARARRDPCRRRPCAGPGRRRARCR